MTTSEPPGPAAVPLPGGRMTSGIVRIGDRVRRPAGPWTPAVHEYLRHLEAAGVPHAAIEHEITLEAALRGTLQCV